jgi:hypothetical protein
VSLPLTNTFFAIKKDGTTSTMGNTDSSGNDAFYILPYSKFSTILGDTSKNCTAYFDVDPNPPNLPKLTVELWNTKTNQLDTGAGHVVDSRFTINFGDGYNKGVTYYNADKVVRLRSLYSHIEKANSGARTYWEFTRWRCYTGTEPNEQAVEPFLSSTLRDVLVLKGTLNSVLESLTRKPQLRFKMPTVDTVCQVFFNSELDIAGQELKEDFNTEGKGALDTGEPTFLRYPNGDSKNNEEREREGLFWAQPAILMVENFINGSNLEKAWERMETYGLTDKELFPKPEEGTVEEGKKMDEEC